jgi:hypothetical protein
MVLWDKLRRVSDYLRKLRLSLGPDSYFHYKRERKYERERADDARARVQDSAEQEEVREVRESEYEERYARERERDIARERSERADEVEPDGS